MCDLYLEIIYCDRFADDFLCIAQKQTELPFHTLQKCVGCLLSGTFEVSVRYVFVQDCFIICLICSAFRPDEMPLESLYHAVPFLQRCVLTWLSLTSTMIVSNDFVRYYIVVWVFMYEYNIIRFRLSKHITVLLGRDNGYQRIDASYIFIKRTYCIKFHHYLYTCTTLIIN